MVQKLLFYGGIMLLLLVVMLLFYYFFNIKKMKQQKAYFSQLHQNLAVGKQVVFMNGIYGRLTRVGEETVDIKVKSGEVMEVSRFAISEIIG